MVSDAILFARSQYQDFVHARLRRRRNASSSEKAQKAYYVMVEQRCMQHASDPSTRSCVNMPSWALMAFESGGFRRSYYCPDCCRVEQIEGTIYHVEHTTLPNMITCIGCIPKMQAGWCCDVTKGTDSFEQ